MKAIMLLRAAGRLRGFVARWQNTLALLIVSFYIFVAIAAPRLAVPKYPGLPPAFQRAENQKGLSPQPPSEEILFGTVPMGGISGHLDIYYTLVWGTRSALVFGLTVAVATATLGILIGATSAYFGGLYNSIVMRVTDSDILPRHAGADPFRRRLESVGGWVERLAEPAQNMSSSNNWQVHPIYARMITRQPLRRRELWTYLPIRSALP